MLRYKKRADHFRSILSIKFSECLKRIFLNSNPYFYKNIAVSKVIQDFIIANRIIG